MWAQIKNEVARKNTKFKISVAKELFYSAVQHVTPENCKCNMWTDHLMEKAVESLIINLGSNSESADYIDSD